MTSASIKKGSPTNRGRGKWQRHDKILAMDRECTGCKIKKPLTDFYVAKNGKASGDKLVVKSRCKACQSAAARKWSKDNPERRNRNRWLYEIRTRYGMTEADWEALLVSQGGGCAICGVTEPNGNHSRLSVDHCHATGRVRGILCNNCNRAIGLLKDDARQLRKAADYLERE